MNKFIKILTLVFLLAAMLAAVGCADSGENSGDNPSQQITSNNTENGGGSSQSGSSNNTDGQTEQYTITFKQDGKEDVVRYVKKGETLTDIPACAEKQGYTVVWDKTDFTNVSGNITVNAVATANEYKIYFSGIVKENVPSGAGLSFDEEKQTYYAVVKYDAAYTLPLCVKEVYKKTTKWKKDGAEYTFSGTYSELADITLSPVWEDVRENEKDWSKWY